MSIQSVYNKVKTTFRNRKLRLGFPSKQLQKPSHVLESDSSDRGMCIRMTGREKTVGGKEQFMIQKHATSYVKNGGAVLWYRNVWLPMQGHW